jgi:hypothetical protein
MTIFSLAPVVQISQSGKFGVEQDQNQTGISCDVSYRSCSTEEGHVEERRNNRSVCEDSCGSGPDGIPAEPCRDDAAILIQPIVDIDPCGVASIAKRALPFIPVNAR